MDAAIDPIDSTSSSSSNRRRVLRRGKTSDLAQNAAAASTGVAGVPASLIDGLAPLMPSLQVVHSPEEADALVRRLRQLETEGAQLSHTMAKICDENSRLTVQLSTWEKKLDAIAQAPLQDTPVLHSLFEPEKAGWFGGSKTAAREQLEQLSEALQSEFTAYKASHTSSNDEVQALVEALHAAHLNAQELSKLVNAHQQSTTNGPLSVQIEVVPMKDQGDGMTVAELKAQLSRSQDQAADLTRSLKKMQEEMRSVSAENTRLKSSIPLDGTAAAAAGGVAATAAMSVVPQQLEEQIAKLKTEVGELHDALTKKDKACAAATQRSEDLERQLKAKESVHAAETSDLRQQLNENLSTSMVCAKCEDRRREAAAANDEAKEARQTVQDLRQQLLQNTVEQQTKYAAIEKQASDLKQALEQKDKELCSAVPAQQYSQLESEKISTARELEVAKKRIVLYESMKAEREEDVASENSLSETKVLETLHSSKERIAKLEIDCAQLKMQLQEAQMYALERDTAAQKVQQTAQVDQQRVAFLLKKCAGLTADWKSSAAQLEAFKEQYEKQSLELKQEKRNTENMAALQRNYDDLSREKRVLAERLASTEELEEKLVKAKETIAYMELSASQSINMSQYAELKSQHEKLQSKVEPVQRQLDEAAKEIERLRSVTDAQQAISSQQNNNVRSWQDQVSALSDSEAKLREKVSSLTTENTRLTQLNASLEQQMSDMQDGIKEMAVHMEKDRTTAKANAEAATQKEMQRLRTELEKAQAVIADVQQKDGHVVAEGLYAAVVADRDHLTEEANRRNFEVEKMKSEITIYRQTISDLEQENDERVREIEAMQDRYQSDRASLAERLTNEQTRSTDLTAANATLTGESSSLQATIKQHEASIAALTERNSKQQRAFEDKCRREEALINEIDRLKAQVKQLEASATAAAAATSTAVVAAAGRPPLAQTAVSGEPVKVMEVPASAAAPLASSLTPPDTAALDNLRKEQFRLQLDNEQLSEELERLKIRYAAATKEDQDAMESLQTQLKGRMSAQDRSIFDAQAAKCMALRQSNEVLILENDQLKRQLRPTTAAAVSAAASAAVVTASEAQATQQLDMMQLQAALQAQRSAAVEEAKAYKSQIRLLEDQLQEIQGGDGDNASAADSLGQPKPAKKVKKMRRKRTLAEQVGAHDDSVDVLATVAVNGDNSSMADDANGELAKARAELLDARREVATLRSENISLKETIAKLTADLKAAELDIQNAHEDFDASQVEMDKERGELQEQIKKLQTQQKGSVASSSLVHSPPSGQNASFGSGNRSFRAHSIQDLEMRLRCFSDENERLQAEVKQLESHLHRSRSASMADGSFGGANSADDVFKLQKQLRQKDAEAKALSDQLMPTKEKLVEYMAMADRLGLQYPFPPELEGATVMRLKAMHIKPSTNRAGGSSSTQRHSSLNFNSPILSGSGVSPFPKMPQSRYATPANDGLSLR